MINASKIREHMSVVGSDSQHIGMVDCVKEDNIILTKSDSTSQGKHHSIPLSWVSSVQQNEVRLNQTTEEARQNWIAVENPNRQAASTKVCP